MDPKYCKNCDYLAKPVSFRGVEKGILQWKFYENDEDLSCCHPIINGGAQILGLSECPKNIKDGK